MIDDYGRRKKKESWEGRERAEGCLYKLERTRYGSDERKQATKKPGKVERIGVQ